MALKERLKKIEVARTMRREGIAVDEIASKVGVSKGSIYKWLRAKPVRARRMDQTTAASRKSTITSPKMVDIIAIVNMSIPDKAKLAALREIV